MLGKNRYKVINDVDMSNDRLLSLISFYMPLLDAESISLYQYLLFERDADAKEISDLITGILLMFSACGGYFQYVAQRRVSRERDLLKAAEKEKEGEQ